MEEGVEIDQDKFSGEPGGIRTPDPQLRRLLLYPAELRALVFETIDLYYYTASCQ